MTRRLALSVSEPKRQWIGELPRRWGILQFVRQSGLNVPNVIFSLDFASKGEK